MDLDNVSLSRDNQILQLLFRDNQILNIIIKIYIY